MEKTSNTTPIRLLMPEGFLETISLETGMEASNISKVVKTEKFRSYIWPVVERLAKETDSKAYAKRLELIVKREKAQKAMKQAYRRIAA